MEAIRRNGKGTGRPMQPSIPDQDPQTDGQPKGLGAGDSSRGRLAAILRQRCPRCRQGRVFKGLVEMNTVCPVCGLRFEREEGYFLGAMYFSYGMSVLILGVGTLLAALVLPDWRLELVMLLVVAAYLPFVPIVFRYSRVLWMHFDRWAWH
jgi:uncharacterized protein (DUF983 family)